MARNLEDIFNECYERMRSGESLQSCLARYPEHRAELKSLLETAFDVGRRASYIHPRPEFKHWAQVRIQGAQHYSRQQRQVETPSHFSWWRQSWAVAVTAVLILLLTTGSTMAASSNAMPDQTLYPVKLATEEMRLALAVTDTQKAQIHTQLAETRAVEVETMADNGNTEQAAFATERLIAELERANAAIAKVEGTAIPIPIPIPIPEPTPTVTPPEETITPPQETTTTTPPEETVTPPQETTATTPPEETVTPPEETTTPPDSTKGKTTSTQKTERFKKSLENSTSKSLTALKNAHEKASEQAKPDWQQSIDTISKSYHKQTHEHGTGQSDNTTGKSDNTTTKQWGTSNNVSPNQSQYPSWNWQNHR